MEKLPSVPVSSARTVRSSEGVVSSASPDKYLRFCFCQSWVGAGVGGIATAVNMEAMLAISTLAAASASPAANATSTLDVVSAVSSSALYGT